MKQLTARQMLFHRGWAQLKSCTSARNVLVSLVICAVVLLRKVVGGARLWRLEMRLRGGVAAREMRRYEDGACYDFKGIRLPRPEPDDYDALAAMYYSVQDVLYSYLFANDSYSRETVEQSDRNTCEGVYLYRNGDVDLTIKEGDVVLDLGACYGEFSAYAAKMGARCYAFEPSGELRPWLQRTIELNKGSRGAMIMVPYAVDAQNGAKTLENDPFLRHSARVVEEAGAPSREFRLERIETVRLDDWVQREGIRVDFIKADIEGAERRMLEGASDILKNQQPALSLCTYHLPDDPEVMRDLILKANPRYRIIQRRMKLLAYVPREGGR